MAGIMAAIEHGNRQEIQKAQIHVEHHAKPQSELPAIRALEDLVVKVHDANRAAEVLQSDPDFGDSTAETVSTIVVTLPTTCSMGFG